MTCTARFVLHGSILRRTLIVGACVLASACFQTPVALAQRGAGHSGGAGGHFNSGGHMGIPHVVAPRFHKQGFRGLQFSQVREWAPLVSHFGSTRFFAAPCSAILCSLAHRFCGRAWDSILFGARPAVLSGPGDSAHPSIGMGLKITSPRSRTRALGTSITEKNVS